MNNISPFIHVHEDLTEVLVRPLYVLSISKNLMKKEEEKERFEGFCGDIRMKNNGR